MANRSVKKPPPVAKDGLVARSQRAYAKGKLKFLCDFVPVALKIAAKKIDRVYIELFAGPGLNVDKKSLEEFDGSPLLMSTLPARPRGKSFTRAIFINKDKDDHEALTRRLNAQAAADGMTTEKYETVHSDANVILPSLLNGIHPAAYVLVFADLEGISQLPWTTVTQLKARHTSVDLYVLFPLELSLNRLLGANAAHRRKHEVLFSNYFGCEDWQPIAERWVTNRRGAECRAALEALYLSRLRTLWPHAGVVTVARFGARRLFYRMMFTTKSVPAQKAAKWAASQGDNVEQLSLLDGR